MMNDALKFDENFPPHKINWEGEEEGGRECKINLGGFSFYRIFFLYSNDKLILSPITCHCQINTKININFT